MDRTVDSHITATANNVPRAATEGECSAETEPNSSMEIFASRLAGLLLEQCMAKRPALDEKDKA